MYYHKAACRTRLKPCDYNFIHSVFVDAGESEKTLKVLLGDSASFDVLLDDARLFQALIEYPRIVFFSPALYFYVLVRHVFLDVGLDRRGLADYVASVLGYAMAGASSSESFYWADLVLSLEGLDAEERFYKILGWANFTLFMTGVFPDFVAQREQRRGAPSLDFYESAAASCYRMAEGHSLASQLDLREVFGELGDAFPLARKGLNALRDRLIFIRQPLFFDLNPPPSS